MYHSQLTLPSFGRRKLFQTGRCVTIFLLLSVSLFAVKARDYIPDVNLAIIRLDYQTYEVEGFYEFSQSYRKSLPEEGFVRAGNVFYEYVEAGDFGYTEILSRLTSESILMAETIWDGMGDFLYPPDSLFSTIWEGGYDNPSPDSLLFVPLFFGSPEQLDSVWSAVKETDIIKRIADLDVYEVVIFDHFYTVGMADPSTAEWFVIAFTHPPAPDDIAFVEMVWPRTIITRNITTTPEILVHNFSDTAHNVSVHLELLTALGSIYETTVATGVLPADSSRLLSFDPFSPIELDSIEVHATLVNSDGSLWDDSFPENNEFEQQIAVTDQPVFKPISSYLHPGSIPIGGFAVDFDGDGDIDVYKYGYNPKLLQNDGSGNFTDITEWCGITFPHHAGLAAVEDFNGDSYIDLLIYDSEPKLFTGDGTGFYEDITEESGLSQLTGIGPISPFDKDNDGDLDLIMRYYEEKILLENDGLGYFLNVSEGSGISNLSQTDHFAVGDLNTDGYADLVLTNWGDLSTVFINNGDGTFYFLDGPWDFFYGRMALCFDYDGDGLQDILFTQRLYNELSKLYKNMGALTFQDVSVDVGGFPKAFNANSADFNGDGHPDLVLSDTFGGTLLLNQGGVFVDRTDLLVDLTIEVSGLRQAKFIDLDQDGDLDIYSRSVVFENQGLDSTTLDVNPIDRSLPRSIYLSQNYPNPFNAKTIIHFELPEAANVELVIYDILGRKVEELVSGRVVSGEHEVVWDASNVASGVYFYRLIAGDRLLTRKLVVLK